MTTIPDIHAFGAPATPGAPGKPDQENGAALPPLPASDYGTRKNKKCHGGTGGHGGPGGDAPTVGFQIGRLVSDFQIRSDGATGGDGGRGGNGGNGGDGQNSATNDPKCVSGSNPKCPPAQGGPGGPGAEGGNGGPGGEGGNGGDIYVFYWEAQTPGGGGHVPQVVPNSLGALGGNGGPAGANGQGGQGGTNEQVKGKTIPPNAPSGEDPRKNPSPGVNGASGTHGIVVVQNVGS